MMYLHLCPYCDYEPLAVIRDKNWVRIVCRECGWSHTFVPPPNEDELGECIEAVVTEAKE